MSAEDSMRAVRGETEPAQPRPGQPGESDNPALATAELRYPGFGALFLIWTAVGAVTSARHYFEPSSRPDTQELAWFFACIAYLYPWIGLTPLAFRLERRFPLGTGGWRRHLAWLAMFSVGLCLVAAPLMLVVMWLVVSPFGVPIRPPRNLLQLFRFFPVAQAMFWSTVAGGTSFGRASSCASRSEGPRGWRSRRPGSKPASTGRSSKCCARASTRISCSTVSRTSR